MNINIYYGGRGIIDDPTLYVVNRMQNVLEELRVGVMRYNLYDMKNAIMTLPQSLKDTDGIVLATTVEWYGMGGFMLEFLDACWLFGNKEAISNIYMMPVVMSTAWGEQEIARQLATAWETLGGKVCEGLTGYIENTVNLEINGQYGSIIDKKAEGLYRAINQKAVALPSSIRTIRQKVAVGKASNLTPQESEQLSKYVSDDSYVKRQKEDIQELASMFMGKLNGENAADETEYIEAFKGSFKPQGGFSAVYLLNIDGKERPLLIKVKDGEFSCEYGEPENANVELQLSRETLQKIVDGKTNFQQAFMSGDIKMKGDFGIHRMLDQLFLF